MNRRKFVQNSIGCSLLITSGVLWSGHEQSYNSHFENKLKLMSLAAFRRFEQIWEFDDFWKRGNTFDACLTFVAAALNRWPNDPEIQCMQLSVKNMLEKNLDYFNSFDPGRLWADDFGWWGLMALKGRSHLLKMEEYELADKYLQLSTEKCWEYKKRTAYDNTDNAKPVPYGCRNGDANGDSKGVKNTVTNVLLFLLSSRIYRLSLKEEIKDSDKYLDMAYRQWLWFNDWFDRGDYLKKMSSVAALVQERPIADFEGSDYNEKTHPPWNEGWVWSGDQGMLIGALTDMYAIRENLATWCLKRKIEPDFDILVFEKRVHHLINIISGGIKLGLIGKKDGIFREAPCESSFGAVHGNDYLAGRGIMMRYIGAKNEKALIDLDFSKHFKKTLEAIWKTRNKKDNQFQPEFTNVRKDKQYIEQFRELWGIADEVVKWDLKKMKEKNKYGVCQSIGFDALGATITSL